MSKASQILIQRNLLALLTIDPPHNDGHKEKNVLSHHIFTLVRGAVASWLVLYTSLWIEQSWFELWLGTLCCVLGQDTLLSQCLSRQVYKWVLANLMLGVTL